MQFAVYGERELNTDDKDGHGWTRMTRIVFDSGLRVKECVKFGFKGFAFLFKKDSNEYDVSLAAYPWYPSSVSSVLFMSAARQISYPYQKLTHTND